MTPPEEPILDPRGGSSVGTTVHLARRTRSLEGATVGLLDNAKPNAARILEHLGEVLQKEHGVANVVMLQKPSFAVPAEEAMLDELQESCDYVIAGVGDCGSCSAGTIADGALLEKRGVPAAAIVTDTFVLPAAAMARVQGFPEYHFVALPHPIASLSQVELEKVADEALAEVLEILGVTA